MSSTGGYASVLVDGRCISVPDVRHVDCDRCISVPDERHRNSDDFNKMRCLSPQKPAEVDSSPGHGVGYTRCTIIQSTGSHCRIKPSYSGTFIFVQGMKSACIVSLDSVKDKKTSYNLERVFACYADSRLIRPAVIRRQCKENVDIRPCAAVSVCLDPGSSHKDPASMSPGAAEELAIDFLKRELKDGCFDDSIMTAISALHRLREENVKAHEIAAYAFRKNKMEFLAEEEIEDYLAVVNKGLLPRRVRGLPRRVRGRFMY